MSNCENFKEIIVLVFILSSCSNYKTALSLLPPIIKVSAVKNFLECVLHTIKSRKYDVQLSKSLLYAEHLQVQAKRIHCHSYKLIVTDLDICRVCQKRIGKSAFAHFPTGVIVHYSCKDQYSAES